MSTDALAKKLQEIPAPILEDAQAHGLIIAGHHKKVAAIERKWAALLAANHEDLDRLEALPQARILRLLAIRLVAAPDNVTASEIREL